MPRTGEAATRGDDAAAQRADAVAINRSMERLIAMCPSQYLWGYHRYKQPRGGALAQAPSAPADLPPA